MSDERFRRAEEQYLALKGELDAGRLTAAGFETALEASMIEHDGRWWMLGATSGAWYVHDGSTWTQAKPPDAPGGRSPVASAAGVRQPEPTGPASVQAGTSPQSGGSVVVPGAGAAAQRPVRKAPSGALATLLRGLLGLSLTLGSAGIVLTLQIMESGDWDKIGMANWVLVVAAFLLGLSVVPLFPTIPYGVILITSAVWSLLGFLGLQGFAPVHFMWWGPDIVFATGLAGLLGGLIGFGISKWIGKAAVGGVP